MFNLLIQVELLDRGTGSFIETTSGQRAEVVAAVKEVIDKASFVFLPDRQTLIVQGVQVVDEVPCIPSSVRQVWESVVI